MAKLGLTLCERTAELFLGHREGQAFPSGRHTGTRCIWGHVGGCVPQPGSLVLMVCQCPAGDPEIRACAPLWPGCLWRLHLLDGLGAQGCATSQQVRGH